MVTESQEDGEGELLRRLRGVLGDIPIGVSLDLHANISPAMVRLATVMTVYRTYPHLDMSDTRARCIQRLVNVIDGQAAISAFRQVPFLIPLHSQYTQQSPCQMLYQKLNDPALKAGEWIEFAMGFSAADVYDCGPSIIAYAQSEERASQLADRLTASVQQQRSSFDTSLLSACRRIHKKGPAKEAGKAVSLCEPSGGVRKALVADTKWTGVSIDVTDAHSTVVAVRRRLRLQATKTKIADRSYRRLHRRRWHLSYLLQCWPQYWQVVCCLHFG